MAQVAIVETSLAKLSILSLAAFFVWTGAIKAFDPIRFASDIDNYKILPWAIAVGSGILSAVAGNLLRIALILRRFYLGGLSILAGLISVFVIATVTAKVRGLDITCGCFGHASKKWNFSTHLGLDLVLFRTRGFFCCSRGAEISTASQR
jgi:hypothetical protein